MQTLKYVCTLSAQFLYLESSDASHTDLFHITCRKDGFPFKSKWNGTAYNLYVTGWLDCPAYGNELGCIIPSKVPLGESFSEKIVPGKRYTPREVIHQQKCLGREASFDC